MQDSNAIRACSSIHEVAKSMTWGIILEDEFAVFAMGFSGGSCSDPTLSQGKGCGDYSAIS